MMSVWRRGFSVVGAVALPFVLGGGYVLVVNKTSSPWPWWAYVISTLAIVVVLRFCQGIARHVFVNEYLAISRAKWMALSETLSRAEDVPTDSEGGEA